MNGEAALLTVTDLHVSYQARRRRTAVAAVRGASLTVRSGEIEAIVGESGSGKSTFARAVVGLLTPDRGRIEFDGTALTARRSAGQRRAIQMVFQDPRSSLNPRMRVHQIIGEAWRTHPGAAPAVDRRASLAELLGRVGLDSAMADRRVTEMSGGQAQRVSLARALAVRPRLLVCDEAVSALDVSVQTQILTLLLELRDTLGLSILFITHDLGVVRQVADRVTVMQHGTFVEHGPAEQLYTAPQHPYTRELLDAALDLSDVLGDGAASNSATGQQQ